MKHFFAIVLGYIAASLAGGATVFMVAMGGLEGWPFGSGVLAFSVLAAATVTLITAFPAALALIVIAEVANIQTWVYYVLGGGLAAMATFLAMGLEPIEGMSATDAPFTAAIVAGGMTAGLVYWAIAGHKA